MARGELLGCWALTEIEGGSDPMTMRTRAWRDGSDWILSGGKAWITNGSIADVALVWVNTDEGMNGFLVPTDTVGFGATPVEHKLSMRASDLAHLTLDDVRVPDSARLPGSKTLRSTLTCLNAGRFGIVWGTAGAARACFEAALAHAKDRGTFGKPIAAFQMQQERLVRMVIEVSRTALVALQLGRLQEAGLLRPEQISMAKIANVNDALSVARAARQVFGASGITLEHPPMRHLANLESLLTSQGTLENQMLTVGRSLTGVDAFV